MRRRAPVGGTVLFSVAAAILVLFADVAVRAATRAELENLIGVFPDAPPLGLVVLETAVDVLATLDYVDRGRIGAIGHSAGGNVLVYFMFMDPRVKAGVSSCGFYELLDDFNDRDRSFSNSVFAVPGLARVGGSADYLAHVAPRAVLMMRGLHEMSTEERSREHAERTRRIGRYAAGVTSSSVHRERWCKIL